MTTLYVPDRSDVRRRSRRQRRIALSVLTIAGLLGCTGWALRNTEPPMDASADTVLRVTPPAMDLDPELAARFAAAQDAAAADGVTLALTSGWRSAADQEVLVAQVLDRYGEPEAHRWVLPTEHSAHVQGLAIDVGPTEGAYWLAQHGFDLGLCQTYTNEIWHYEKLADGADACPEPHSDASWAW